MRPLCLLLVLHCPLLLAGELDGHYQSELDDMPAELIVRQQGETVSGEYIENHRLRLLLKGHYDGELLRGQISDPQTGLVLANINATFGNAMLNTSIAARDPHSGEVHERQALFQRVQQAPAGQPEQAAARQDPALIGTWVHERMISSGGASFASFSSVMVMQLSADGRVTQWRSAAAGNNDWSHDSPGEVQYSGRWRSENGMLMVRLDGAEDYQPAAYYRFSDEHLITDSNTGSLTWQRRP